MKLSLKELKESALRHRTLAGAIAIVLLVGIPAVATDLDSLSKILTFITKMEKWLEQMVPVDTNGKVSSLRWLNAVIWGLFAAAILLGTGLAVAVWRLREGKVTQEQLGAAQEKIKALQDELRKIRLAAYNYMSHHEKPFRFKAIKHIYTCNTNGQDVTAFEAEIVAESLFAYSCEIAATAEPGATKPEFKDLNFQLRTDVGKQVTSYVIGEGAFSYEVAMFFDPPLRGTAGAPETRLLGYNHHWPVWNPLRTECRDTGEITVAHAADRFDMVMDFPPIAEFGTVTVLQVGKLAGTLVPSIAPSNRQVWTWTIADVTENRTFKCQVTRDGAAL